MYFICGVYLTPQNHSRFNNSPSRFNYSLFCDFLLRLLFSPIVGISPKKLLSLFRKKVEVSLTLHLLERIQPGVCISPNQDTELMCLSMLMFRNVARSLFSFYLFSMKNLRFEIFSGVSCASREPTEVSVSLGAKLERRLVLVVDYDTPLCRVLR